MVVVFVIFKAESRICQRKERKSSSTKRKDQQKPTSNYRKQFRRIGLFQNRKKNRREISTTTTEIQKHQQEASAIVHRVRWKLSPCVCWHKHFVCDKESNKIVGCDQLVVQINDQVGSRGRRKRADRETKTERGEMKICMRNKRRKTICKEQGLRCELETSKTNNLNL